jgi:hypothetical protein
MEILAGQHTMNGGVWKVEWNIGKKQVCGGVTNGKEGNADPPYFVHFLFLMRPVPWHILHFR